MQKFVLMTTMLLSFLGLAIVIPVFAPLLIDAGESTILLGFLIAIYPLASLFGTPVAEAVSDRIGRKPAIFATLLIAALSYFLCAIGIHYDHITLLFVARFIGGFAGISGAVVMQAVGDQPSEQTKASWMSSMATIGGVGFLIGPLLGGKLADPAIVSWFRDTTPFWTAAILMALGALLALLFFRETLEQKRQTPYNIWRGLRTMIEPFQVGSLKRIASVLLLFGTAWSFFVDFFPVYLVQKWDFTAAQIGDFYIYVTAWYFLTQWFLVGPTRRVLRFSRLLPILLLIAPFAQLLLLVPWQYKWLYYIAPLTIIAMTMALPLLFSLLPTARRWESAEHLAQVSHSLQNSGYIIAPILGGFLASWFPPLPTIAAATCALAAWLILVSRPRSTV